MDKKQIEAHAGAVEKYIQTQLAAFAKQTTTGRYRRFTIAKRGYPNNDLGIEVTIKDTSDIQVVYVEEDSGPNDKATSIADTDLEFKAELLVHWQHVKYDLRCWMDEVKEREAQMREQQLEEERVLCAKVPDDFEV